MILIIKPLLMLAFKRSFQGKVEEVSVRLGLNANSTHHLAHGGTRLLFREEVMLE
jgi:hypothetical protein